MAAKKKKAVETRYFVAKGKALTTKKGLLGPGTELKADYFPGGQERLDELVVSGSAVKK